MGAGLRQKLRTPANHCHQRQTCSPHGPSVYFALNYSKSKPIFIPLPELPGRVPAPAVLYRIIAGVALPNGIILTSKVAERSGASRRVGALSDEFQSKLQFAGAMRR